MADTDVGRTVAAVWRMEAGRIVAGLTRLVGDVGLAEDFGQEAVLAALEQWPSSGVPANPGAWLTTVARRRALDHLRRAGRFDEKEGEVAREVEARREESAPDPDARLDDPVGDDLLRLVFTCCHPVLAPEARVALTLRAVGGLETEEIARAFLVPKATLAQRIVRAKRTLREARVPFETPRGEELARRLESVLDVVYLIFNEGYAATEGERWARPELCAEALRLGRVLAELAPMEPEVHGLVALMELQASRLRARAGPAGEPVLLLDQDRSRWDGMLIRHGLGALEKAVDLGRPLGRYTLQAAIAACHARARTARETDWERIAALYDALGQLAPSPVVELNRAVAVGHAFGAAAGLELADALVRGGALEGSHLVPAVRGDLLEKAGRPAEAASEFRRAASLTRNEREREILARRAAACAAEAG